MRISDWSSDVCSSDLQHAGHQEQEIGGEPLQLHREDGPDVLDQKGEGGGGIGAGGIGDVPFAPVQPQQEKGGGEQQADARVEQRDEKLSVHTTAFCPRPRRSSALDNEGLLFGELSHGNAVRRGIQAVPRTTRWTGMRVPLRVRSSSSSAIATSASPAASRSGSSVVSAGSARVPARMPSKPISATSCGKIGRAHV